MKRVCFGSDCFRPFAGISGVIGSVTFATAALTAGGDGYATEVLLYKNNKGSYLYKSVALSRKILNLHHSHL